jgi:alkanesulfonate monooxygenase SsuD/methylene tetrahydromethanopterin reductase-like flavin-dependent oxidoreductase (luciferase family)
VLRRHCDAARRDYAAIEKTIIISLSIARDDAGVQAKRERLDPLPDFVGTVSEVVDLIGRYREAGVQLLINSDYRNDLETHELMAAEVMPHFA